MKVSFHYDYILGRYDFGKRRGYKALEVRLLLIPMEAGGYRVMGSYDTELEVRNVAVWHSDGSAGVMPTPIHNTILECILNVAGYIRCRFIAPRLPEVL
jgi:hypothetical protein